MKIGKELLFNLAVRGLSMGARFVLIFCLGKYFSPDELGSYGIFYTTVTLGVLVLGLDFYTYSNREILYVKNAEKLSVLRNQLLFYAVTYALFLFPMLLLFSYNVLPTKFLIFFYVILILEHLSQELYRLFTILSFPVFANTLLFLRTGVWVFLLIGVYILTQTKNYSLDYIFLGWIGGAGLSVIVGVLKVFELFKGFAFKPPTLRWYLEGLKVSSFYFFSTIALVIIESSNRYMIEFWCSLKSVGIFVFFNQIANMINIIIFTLFIMVVYPKFISSIGEKKMLEFNTLKSTLLKNVLLYSISLGLILAVAIYPMLYFVGKNDYFSEVFTFYILILANIVLNISLVYHYILYSLKKDVFLFIATVFGAVASVLFNVVLIQRFEIMGAACSLLASYTVLLIAKMMYAKRAESDFNTKITNILN